MRALQQVVDTLRVLARARRNRLDLVRALGRRPQLLIGTGLYELGIALSARVDMRLKVLAELTIFRLRLTDKPTGGTQKQPIKPKLGAISPLFTTA